MKAEQIIEQLKSKYGEQKEYIQAVSEVLYSIEEEYNKHPEFEQAHVIERLIIPDRIIIFRVNWVDDKGVIQTNTGYRIQYNNAIGPYKGGLRFHPSVNLSVLKFLGFEQIFKNALTTLPMGGGKGGSDFDPHGKSDNEVMHFCQAFMTELYQHIGADEDVPAGDIGVGAREVGYLFGMYKKLTHTHTGVLTGKGLEYGGSLIRPEATGYGNVYFMQEMLKTRGMEIEGKRVLVSGSGNVAQYTIKKLIDLGAKPITVSDSNGVVYVPDGITQREFEYIQELKNKRRGRIKEFAERYGYKYFEGQKPWQLEGTKPDIAMPSATQNEITAEDAEFMLKNGVFCVSEGANMPTTPKAIDIFQNAKILYAPGKAANAGGVSVSGLEMSQNSERLLWDSEKVDHYLHNIMVNIHNNCVKYGVDENGYIDYKKGANIAGFLKVAKAVVAQGVI